MGAGYRVIRYKFSITLLFGTSTTIITQDINPPTGKLLGVFSDKSCMNVLAGALSNSGQGHPIGGALPLARDVMVTRLVTTTPEMDVFVAIGGLLKNGVSGAPVIDAEGKFVGVFSERLNT